MIEFVRSGKPVRLLPKSLGDYRKVFDEISVSGAVLVMRSCRVVVPIELRKQIMELAHLGSKNQGADQVSSLISRHRWRYRSFEFIKDQSERDLAKFKAINYIKSVCKDSSSAAPITPVQATLLSTPLVGNKRNLFQKDQKKK